AQSWLDYFRRHGDIEKAEKEQASLARLRETPSSAWESLVWTDYAGWLLLATSAGLLFALAVWLRQLVVTLFQSLRSGNLPRWADLERLERPLVTPLLLAAFLGAAVLGVIFNSAAWQAVCVALGVFALVRIGWQTKRGYPLLPPFDQVVSRF